MIRFVRAAAMSLLCVAFVAAAPATGSGSIASPSGPFVPAATIALPNGAVIASQTSADTALVAVQLFLPAGSAQQATDRAGIAGVTAAMVLQTPVEGAVRLTDVADELGAALSYTIDQQDTRFSIECRASDLPRLVGDLASALKQPDTALFAKTRDAAIATANDAIRDPAQTAYAMIRQAEFEGTAYARPDAGGPTSLGALGPADALAFAAEYRHGAGTVASLAGDVTADGIGAIKSALSDFSATALPRPPQPKTLTRTRQVVAHRAVVAPWVAVGYSAPSQYGSDFPAMLVIETLLGRGGDIHSFAFGSDATPPDDFVGGYYQYEAQPGLFVEFFNGANVDRDLRNLENGVGRLRGDLLPADLLARAKGATLGEFLTSIATLDDQSWLLGRAALSPSGAALENDLPGRINTVTAADVRRVARKYLATQTIAVVLPTGSGQ